MTEQRKNGSVGRSVKESKSFPIIRTSNTECSESSECAMVHVVSIFYNLAITIECVVTCVE